MYGHIVGLSKMIHAPSLLIPTRQDVQQLCPNFGSNPLRSKQLGPDVIAKKNINIE